ncbi:BglG family transcription antiterminator [Virgibacillus pantothenticus]|uniref:BglG family transcription antiterminator n=1 Tax=Virgibacillus pantothenticus TaxID=1473 RepID=UPI0009866867|nr:BglG family transcription antiterminator [Virgibacillus pantothenticus]
MRKYKTSDRLINYLLQQTNWQTTAVIAQHLQVSERMIRKCVAEWNEKLDSPVILSSKNGYKLNIASYQKLFDLKNDGNYMPKTKRERLNYIMKKLITLQQRINVYDLSEELFVSEVTIRNDMKDIRDMLKNFNVQVYTKADDFYIVGEEVDMRKVMRFLIAEESKNPVNLRKSIQLILGDININDLQNIITDTLLEHHFFINQYIMENVLLHFAVSIQRVQENYYIKSNATKQKVKNANEYKLAKEITEKIKRYFGVQFNNEEVYNLTLPLIGKTTFSNFESLSVEQLESYVGRSVIELVTSILQKVEQTYFIEMYDQEFVVKLIIHVHNLIHRSAVRNVSKNPLVEEIKASYPLIYDISVFISSLLTEKTGIQINDDEISYIALHIGSYIESKNNADQKVTCAIVCPQYYDIHKAILHKTRENFNSSLLITRLITDLNQPYDHLDVDLIITTTMITSKKTKHILVVRPFLTEQDIKNISTKISFIKKQKNMDKMEKYVTKFFRPELFFRFKRNELLQDKYKIIEFMGKNFTQYNYTDLSFINKVKERERLSSTAFHHGVAVPHSMTMDAIKTGVSILIMEEAVQWDTKYVSVIVLIAINKQDSHIFGYIFENFINILSDEANIEVLRQSSDYKDFSEKLLFLMNDQESNA